MRGKNNHSWDMIHMTFEACRIGWLWILALDRCRRPKGWSIVSFFPFASLSACIELRKYEAKRKKKQIFLTKTRACLTKTQQRAWFLINRGKRGTRLFLSYVLSRLKKERKKERKNDPSGSTVTQVINDARAPIS